MKHLEVNGFEKPNSKVSETQHCLCQCLPASSLPSCLCWSLPHIGISQPPVDQWNSVTPLLRISLASPVCVKVHPHAHAQDKQNREPVIEKRWWSKGPEETLNVQ